MKIARYIGDLLFDYECVVIPGFGGFITKEVPAKIHPVQNHFVPPSKDIVFNVHLKANDGLLINHIAQSEKITYAEARESLERFVEQCESALKDGKRIRFRKVGVIFLNKDGFKQFEPDSTQNYLADSYGLKSFISPPIKRSISGRPVRVQNTHQDRKAASMREAEVPKKDKKSKTNEPRYIRINVSAVIILVIASAFLIIKFNRVKEYYQNYSSLIPFFYSSPNSYLIENFGELGVANLFDLGELLKKAGDKLNINYELPLAKADSVDLDQVAESEIANLNEKNDSLENSLQNELAATQTQNEPVLNPETETSGKAEPVNLAPATNNIEGKKYFIIAGAFQDMANADKFVLELKQKGFDANIAGKNKYDQYRVYYNSYNNLNDANKQLAIIRKEQNSSAWILVL